MKSLTIRRILASAVALAAAVTLSSCINSTTTLTVNKDGSGTIEERAVLGAQFVQMMKQFAAGFGQPPGQQASPDNPLMQDEAKYKERATKLGEGVTFVSVEEINEANGMGALTKYSFSDITKLQLSMSETTSALNDIKSSMPQPGQTPGAPEEEAPSDDPLRFEFDKGSPAKLTIHLPRPDKPETEGDSTDDTPAEPARTPSPAELAQAKQIMGDMGFSLVLKVDGEVTESTATHQEGNTTTLLSMEMGKMLDSPESFAKMQSLEKEEDFDKVKNVLKDIPGMKFEMNETIEIEFK